MAAEGADPLDELAKLARDTTYTAIGLGVLALQAGRLARSRYGLEGGPASLVSNVLRTALRRSDEEDDTPGA